MDCQTRSGIDSRIIKHETTLVDICRDQDLKQSDVEGSTEALLKAGENNLVTNLLNDPVLRLTVSLEAGLVCGKPMFHATFLRRTSNQISRLYSESSKSVSGVKNHSLQKDEA